MAGKSRRADLITDCSQARIFMGVVAVSRFGDAGGAGTYTQRAIPRIRARPEVLHLPVYVVVGQVVTVKPGYGLLLA